MRKILYAGIALMLCAGCATTKGINKDDQEIAFRHAWDAYGDSEDFNVIIVPSHGAAADAAFIAQSERDGPSWFARQLAQTLSLGATENTKVAVYGSNSAKTAQVIKDALSLNKGQLQQLELLYIGDPRFSDEIKGAAAQKGITYRFTDTSQ